MEYQTTIYLVKNEKTLTKAFESTTGTLLNIIPCSGEETLYKITLAAEKNLKLLPTKKGWRPKNKTKFKTIIVHRVFAINENDLPAETISKYLNKKITVTRDSIDL